MREISLKENNTGLKVFIDGEPNFKEMSEENLTVLATVLELTISRLYENYVKRKRERKKDTVP